MSSKTTQNRPTTPLRSLSRTSLRTSQTPTTHPPNNNDNHPSLHSPLTRLEPAFAELSDSLVDLEANMQLLCLQHESVARFTENFAAFLYGIDMNAYCVDWTQAPSRESWKRVRMRDSANVASIAGKAGKANGNSGLEPEEEDETILAPQTPPGKKRGGTTAGSSAGIGRIRGRGRGRGQGIVDASILSTNSSRTMGTSSTTSQLRTPARKSGIARGAGIAGQGSSRPASSASASASGTRGGRGGIARGRAAGSLRGRAGRSGRGVAAGRGVSSVANGGGGM